jgi:hypothetical protein
MHVITKNSFYQLTPLLKFQQNKHQKNLYRFKIVINQYEVYINIEIYKLNQKNKINIKVIDNFKQIDEKTKKDIEKISI